MALISCAHNWMQAVAAIAAMTLGAAALGDGPLAPNRPFALPSEATPATAEPTSTGLIETLGPTAPLAAPKPAPQPAAIQVKKPASEELVKALEPAPAQDKPRDPIAETIKAQDDRAKDRTAKVKARESRTLGASNETSSTNAESKSDAAPAASSAPAESSWARTAVALAGVVALAVVVAWVFKSAARANGGLMSKLGAGGRAPSGVVEVLARYPVGKGQTLVLFKVDRRVLVVSQNHGKNGPSMNVLTEVVDSEDVAALIAKTAVGSKDSSVEKFRKTLAKADRDTKEVLAAPAPAPAAKVAKPVVNVNRQAVIATLGARPGKSKEDAVAELRRKLTAIRSGTGMGVSA